MRPRAARHGTMPEWESDGGSDFDVGIGVAPDEGHAGKPVFGIEGAADAGCIRDGEDTGRCWKFRARDFSADGARSDLDLRVIANAFDFAQFAVGHKVNLVGVFGKPDGSVDRDSSFAEGGKRDVVLAAYFFRDGHDRIVNVGS